MFSISLFLLFLDPYSVFPPSSIIFAIPLFLLFFPLARKLHPLLSSYLFSLSPFLLSPISDCINSFYTPPHDINLFILISLHNLFKHHSHLFPPLTPISNPFFFSLSPCFPSPFILFFNLHTPPFFLFNVLQILR